jgi:hypothetical protein
MSVKKASALAAAVLATAFAALPINTAEARYHRNGHLRAGVAAGALVGGALLAAPRAYGYPHYYGGPAYVRGPVYVEEPADCYIQRQRVWSERRGRYITVNREVCD